MSASHPSTAPPSANERLIACCDTVLLDSCCPPAEKPACCGQSARASTGGCDAGPAKR